MTTENNNENKNENNVIVTLACNDAYVEYAMILIYSIYSNRNPDRTYEVKLFGNGITQENKQRIESLTSLKFDVQVYDITEELLAKASSENLSPHISIDTYTRFFIVDKLKDYNKLIYIDIDTIVCNDIGILFDTNLNGKIIGASIDPNIQEQYDSKTKKRYLTPELTVYDYFNDTLKLKQPYNYFQAGMLLIDIKKMNEKLPLEKALSLIQNEFRLADQDILNYVLNEDVKILDESWNLIVGYSRKNLEYAKRNLGRTNIFHYAGHRKPWKKPRMKFGDIWWDYAYKLSQIKPLNNLNFPCRYTIFKVPHRIIKGIFK